MVQGSSILPSTRTEKMKRIALIGVLAFFLGLLAVRSAPAQRIYKDVADRQNKAFRQWFSKDLVWKFDELPIKGSVDKARIPWAGYIYPDRAGGTANVAHKYDMAFNGGRGMASAWERQDILAHKTRGERPSGAPRRFALRRVPNWAGHCNGWTAATMRHAEPAKNVVRNGVVFTPADIKGLLAELYIYSKTDWLAGGYGPANPAALHVALGNWIGLGKHPLGMDTSVGTEVWNYPIYAYSCKATKIDANRVEVKTNIGYTYMVNSEYDKAPKNPRFMYFHYMLELDDKGNIIGGQNYRDSNQVDLLWIALQPTQGGTAGNEAGNPYLNCKKVLAMWRESAPENKRMKWYNIDPTAEDLILDAEEDATPETDTPPADDATVSAVE